MLLDAEKDAVSVFIRSTRQAAGEHLGVSPWTLLTAVQGEQEVLVRELLNVIPALTHANLREDSEQQRVLLGTMKEILGSMEVLVQVEEEARKEYLAQCDTRCVLRNLQP